MYRACILDYTHHAKDQMTFRGITETDVEEAFARMSWFEQKPNGQVVFVGTRHDGQRLWCCFVRNGEWNGAARWKMITVGVRGQITVEHILASKDSVKAA